MLWNSRMSLRGLKGRSNLILFLLLSISPACAFKQSALLHQAMQEEAGEAKRLIQKGRSSQA
ncbi:MAG: hypothetical protein Q7R83_02590, partial [bacterium]|nr:hypothetical protein [bacterium]